MPPTLVELLKLTTWMSKASAGVLIRRPQLFFCSSFLLNLELDFPKTELSTLLFNFNFPPLYLLITFF